MVAAGVRRAVVENGKLAVKPHSRTADQRDAGGDTGAVDGVAGGEIVAAVEYHVGFSHQGGQPFAFDAFGHGAQADVGVEVAHAPDGGFGLVVTQPVAGMDDLPLQVGQVDGVVVADGKGADAAGGEVESGRAAQSAGADHQGVAGQQFFLAGDVDVRQQDVAGITDQLFIVHDGRAGRANGPSYTRPGRGYTSSVATLRLKRTPSCLSLR